MFAAELAEVAGGYHEAADLARELGTAGSASLRSLRRDLREVLVRQARDLTLLIDHQGVPERCAELASACDLLAGLATPQREAGPPGLVYTVPPLAGEIVPLGERLDLLVEDLIRMATRTLHIGGPFWNEPGFDRLLKVLSPAVKERGVACTFYVHSWPDRRQISFIRNRIAEVGPQKRVATRWYVGPAESLMHAKFVIRDGMEGYLGTANLTSQGLEQHVEIGVRLSSEQATELLIFLERLESFDLFEGSPESERAAESGV